MKFQLYSQLLRLDYSNDHLLQMYYVLYYELPPQEKEMAKNIHKLIETREKIKLELRRYIHHLKTAENASTLEKRIADFLPVYLKLEYLTKNTFSDPNWEQCYKKERENLRLYYETLYNRNLTSSTADLLQQQMDELRAVPTE